jgi:2-succinyl-5-enolpyruvyl-6-hydroxy-3-cyclohexene-1-carboxylate synthase
MKNSEKTLKILSWFKSLGVEDICICPGGRNAPFVQILSELQDFHVTSAFDERAAGFFTFGKAYSQQKPAVVITTSGTAVAELLPSVVEAFYSSAPLIVVTADRPKKLRGTGSPQVINQFNIFGSYVEKCVDLESGDDWINPEWTQTQPIHLNICFDEPLMEPLTECQLENIQFPQFASSIPQIEAQPLKAALGNMLANPGMPLLIVGPLHPNEVNTVRFFCQSWPGIIYFEAASGLREAQFPQALKGGERNISQLFKNGKLSGVLRLGGVPTVKLWRELENSSLPVVSVSRRPFAGHSEGIFLHGALAVGTTLREEFQSEDVVSQFVQEDHKCYEQIERLCAKYPKSEPALVRHLSLEIPSQDQVYIGNSLPIREWDTFASYRNQRHLWVNRGANGIDGQIASAIGMASKNKELSIVVGDLTALYDTSGPWFKNEVKALRLFVINNKGGRIFERLFNHSAFYNTHDVDFSAWANMWNMSYEKITVPEKIAIHQYGIYEVVTDVQQTELFWKDYGQLWK